MNKPKDIIVFDLDGTIADITHRLPLIQQDKPDWAAFYAKMSEDTVKPVIKWLIDAVIGNGCKVVIVTARPKTRHADTMAWLYKNEIRFHEIYPLRESETDYTPDRELKRAWLKDHKHRIMFVVDDRQRVVDMWRSEGITCLQCAAWDEWKRTPKPQKGKGSSAS